MSKLTKAERKWVADVQAVLNACPSKRIGFATIGDDRVSLFDIARYNDICASMDKGNGDFLPIAEKLGAVFDDGLYFPNPVESTAG